MTINDIGEIEEIEEIEEIWKEIDGFNYSVSTKGRVKNNKTNHMLTPSLNRRSSNDTGGYYQVCLCNKGQKKWLLLHRLVALAFLPNPNNYTDVNHKNPNDKDNNSINNLEWMAHINNCQSVNTTRDIGYIYYRKQDDFWEAKFRHMGKTHSYCKRDKQIVENWLDNRRNEIKNKLPLTEISEGQFSKGGVYQRGNGWRARIIVDKKEKTKSFKTEKEGQDWIKSIRDNIKN